MGWQSPSGQRHDRLRVRPGSRFISDAKKWLAFLGRLRLPAVAIRPCTRLIDEFCDHLSDDRGLAQSTIRIHRWHIGQFLNRYEQQNRPFRDICIRDIDAAIARKGDQDFSSGIDRPLSSAHCEFSSAMQSSADYTRPGRSDHAPSYIRRRRTATGPLVGRCAASACSYGRRRPQASSAIAPLSCCLPSMGFSSVTFVPFDSKTQLGKGADLHQASEVSPPAVLSTLIHSRGSDSALSEGGPAAHVASRDISDSESTHSTHRQRRPL